MVTQQQSSTNGNFTNGGTYGLQRITSDEILVEDIGSEAEERAPKRFQRSTSDSDVSFGRPSIHSASIKGVAEQRPNGGSRRRQSIRDQKAPSDSCSVEYSPGKGYPFNPSAASTPVRPSTSGPREVLQLRQPSIINNTTGFNFGSFASNSRDGTESTLDSFDLLPSITFDDFHTSITSAGPALSDFPVPDGGDGVIRRQISVNGPKKNASLVKQPAKTSVAVDSNSRFGRSGSLLRRHNSTAREAVPKPVATEPIGPPSGPFAMRARRQSQFPSSASSSAVNRSSRKSVGPGILNHESIDHTIPRGRFLAMQEGQNGNTNRSSQVPDVLDKQSFASQSPSYGDGSRSSVRARNAKAKSFHAPPRTAQDSGLNPLKTSMSIYPTIISTARSPARSNDRRTTTPSSGKRLSVLPGHATGLGARTISPTDTHRMKRMSMMPDAPPLPLTPPTPQLDTPCIDIRTTPQSPYLMPPKSITPSSARTTPDPNRKSFSSGLSSSSTNSYNSARTSIAPIRIPQSLSASRLPTLKNRTENSLNEQGEDVPPVPAIPKAYESPIAEAEMPFFSGLKTSLPFDRSSVHSTSTADCLSAQGSDKEAAKVEGNGRQRRGLTLGDDSQAEKKASTGPSNIRRNLQPLRLPPLNLLPLSTPTAAKIAALHDESITERHQNKTITPPPKIGPAKTPSTPMTASKASFFSRRHFEDGQESPQMHPRSSSSHYVLGSEDPSYRATSSSSSSVPATSEQRNGRKAVSPYISSSLPKSSGDFEYLKIKHSTGFNTNRLDCDPSLTRLTGPRAQPQTRLDKSGVLDKPPSPVFDHDTPSIGTSLRRKLSLTRKRSTSKAQVAAERDAEYPPQPPKHDGMPPPRVPASATLSGPWAPTPSPAQAQKTNYLYSRRKASTSSIDSRHDRAQNDIPSLNGSPKRELPQSHEGAATPASLKSNGPAKSHVHKVLGFGVSSTTLKIQAIDNKLDRDDLVAEEEMGRLALKRKDTENAAKQLDDLRRRATPKDRVSPSQALRTARLNLFERGEIIDFKDVYFCGTKDAHKFAGDLNAEAANFGYDDDRGDYNIVNGDHLAYRYEMVDILGKGSFGQVVRCVDHKTGGLVAIKIIRNKKRFHQQALVEVNILQRLREWDPHSKYSMVNFTQSFYFRGHLCISTELLGMNLYEFIKVHEFRGFSLKLIRRFTKQLLNSLVLLKAHKVIHCDLKPENVLLTHPAHSEIKVIDFGSSCLENEKVYTYIQSRFYRSPEVILGMTYGLPIDMWSLGCILAELLTGYPIFPGENEQEQLACIMEVFGPPEKHLIERSTRKKLFFDSLGKPRLTVSSKGRRRRPSSKSLQQVLKCEDEAFLDFLTRCLRWDPDRRMKPDEAIHHEFITGTKPTATRPTRIWPSSVGNSNSSPIKRYNSIHTPATTARPLPDAPVTSFKNGTAVRVRDTQGNGSPIKSQPKRHSTINGLQSNIGIKRASNGAALSSAPALPRAGGIAKVVIAKPDLAAAAAAAASTVCDGLVSNF